LAKWQNPAAVVSDDYLFSAKRIPPFLMASRLTGQGEVMPLENRYHLIRIQPRRSAFTQS
jgi:hypothetical protein